MGWETLRQWGGNANRIAPLTGGVANDVWSVRIDGQIAVGRLGSGPDADLAWEASLLQHLDREGMTVPVPIPTPDGRLFVGGLMVWMRDAHLREQGPFFRHLPVRAIDRAISMMCPVTPSVLSCFVEKYGSGARR